MVIVKLPEKQMYREGPVLLSLIKTQSENILPQLREELKKSVSIHGFRWTAKLLLDIYEATNFFSNSERTRAVLLCGTHGDGGVTGLTSKEKLSREMYVNECESEKNLKISSIEFFFM